MSEEVHNQEVNSEEQRQPEVDVSALMARMEKLEATNNRLLEESKAHKSKYVGLKNEVEEREKASLTENEQWKELLEIEKNKRSEYESQLRETKKSVLQKELNFKVASLAKDAYDVSDIISALPKDMISIDEETLSIGGVEEALNVVRERKPYFFNTSKNSGMASSRPATETGKRNYEELSDAEKNAVFGKALGELF